MIKREEGLVDLHVHTDCSDGLLSPEEVVNVACELGLKGVGITDHDSVAGIDRAIEASMGKELEIVPGIELSANRDETELHILGYYIDWKNETLLARLEKMKENRKLRIENTVALIKEKFTSLNDENIFLQMGTGSWGRLSLARALVLEKVVSDIREAFEKLIGDKGPCYVPHKRLDYKEAMRIITDIGGVPTLAHPGTMGDDAHIEEYVEHGLKGIEVYHYKHKPHDIKKYLRIAEKYNLIVTGGSDCHGSAFHGTMLMGKSGVNFRILEELKSKSKNFI